MPASPSGRARRFLVIGCGSIGQRHIRNLLALQAGEILTFDVRADRREEVKNQFGVEALDDLGQAWEWNPEVTLVTVPTSLHLPLAAQAATHGCHLFIEKPLSDRLDGLDQLLQTVRTRSLITLVGCNMRFQPGLKTIKRLVEEGVVGRVVAARVEVGQYLPEWHPREDYRDTYSARRHLGGGVILDAIHEIDYIRWILGEVEAVACFAGKLSHLEIDTEDTAAILLQFHSGAIGELHLDYVQRTYSRTCRIIGDLGTIQWDYVTGEVVWDAATTGKRQILTNPPGWEPNQMYVEEMRHFLGCLAREEQPALDALQGAEVLKVALAAKASAQTGQVIRLRGAADAG